MSPANLLVTTICDELRLATNFHNKVIELQSKTGEPFYQPGMVQTLHTGTMQAQVTGSAPPIT
jgi:hypothetical protein